MRTKEMKNNKSMRTGVILAVIALITLIALIVTFAKYASQGTGEDNARVAKWGLNVNENLDLKLFSSSYKDPLDQSVTVDASDDASVVAPGTSKQAEVQLGTYSGQPPEVMYHFEPTLTISNLGDTGQDLITKLNENDGFTWTLKVNDGAVSTYNTTDEISAAVAKLGQKDIAPNTYPTNFGPIDNPKITLGWAWDFKNGGDQSDTELGNLIANNNLKSMQVVLGIKAYQCQGCSTEKKDPNLQTTAPDKLTLQIDEASPFTATSDSDGVMSIVSADSTVASVSVANTNSSSKNFSITGVSKGNTEVTISVPETSTYKAATKTISIDVTKKTPSLELDSYEKDYTVPTAGTFEYKYVGDGAVSVTSNDEDIATATVDTENNIVSVTPKSSGTAVITVSATEGPQYKATSVTHNATVIAGTISVESHATGWTYDNVSHSLGYIVTTPNDCNKEYRLSEEEEWTTEPTAKDAGEYTVYYKASKEGYNDATGRFSVTVAKATNPMTFTLDQSSFRSKYSDTDDTEANFKDASGAPAGYQVEYSLEDASAEYFEIEDSIKSVLTCKAKTPGNTYNFKIKATCSYNDTSEPENYLTGVSSQSVVWSVITYQPIYDGNGLGTYVFLPAYTGTDPGCKFYKRNSDGTYTEIFSSGTMADLAAAIANIDPSKDPIENAASVYTDAKDVTFYGAPASSVPSYKYSTWNEVFNSNTEAGATSAGLSPTFVEDLDEGGLETVYFETNTSTTALSEWNFDANQEARDNYECPKLNDVDWGYETEDKNTFYWAYQSLIDYDAVRMVVSSRVSEDDNFVYSWNTFNGAWYESDFNRSTKGQWAAYILSKYF